MDFIEEERAKWIAEAKRIKEKNNELKDMNYKEKVKKLKEELLEIRLVNNVWLNKDEMRIRVNNNFSNSFEHLEKVIKNVFSDELEYVETNPFSITCKIIIPKEGIYLEIENLEKQIAEKKAKLKAMEDEKKRIKRIEKLTNELKKLKGED